MFTTKKGKTVTPSKRLQAKGEMCTLQTGKLLCNAININYVLVLICRIERELNLSSVISGPYGSDNDVFNRNPFDTSKANLNSILRLQKRAARVILNAPFNSQDSWTCLIHLQRLPLTRPLEGFFLSVET